MGEHEPDEPCFRLERRDRDGWRVVVVRGEIDRATAPALDRALAAAAAPGRPVIVDLSRVAFLDAAGIAALVAAADGPTGDGAGIRVVAGDARAVTRPIRVLGLEARIGLYRTVEDGIADGGGGPRPRTEAPPPGA